MLKYELAQEKNASALTQALIERIKNDQSQHLAWCSMAKNVLEQAPIEVVYRRLYL